MWIVGCLTSQQHASVSQGPICSHNFMCCHTETKLVNQISISPSHSKLTPSQPDPTIPDGWNGSHWSGMTTQKNLGASRIQTLDFPFSRWIPQPLGQLGGSGQAIADWEMNDLDLTCVFPPSIMVYQLCLSCTITFVWHAHFCSLPKVVVHVCVCVCAYMHLLFANTLADPRKAKFLRHAPAVAQYRSVGTDKMSFDACTWTAVSIQSHRADTVLYVFSISRKSKKSLNSLYILQNTMGLYHQVRSSFSTPFRSKRVKKSDSKITGHDQSFFQIFFLVYYWRWQLLFSDHWELLSVWKKLPATRHLWQNRPPLTPFFSPSENYHWTHGWIWELMYVPEHTSQTCPHLQTMCKHFWSDDKTSEHQAQEMCHQSTANSRVSGNYWPDDTAGPSHRRPPKHRENSNSYWP